MTFSEHLAAFRAAHPATEVAEVYLIDLNGTARGKLVPAELLDKLAGGGMKIPVSTLALDIFGEDTADAGIAIDVGDPDGVLLPIAETLSPVLWTERPTVQLQCMMTDAGGQNVCGYDPRGVLARVTERAHAMGYHPVVALELEFYLIDPSEDSPPRDPRSGKRLERSQIYDMEVMRAFEPLIGGIARTARALGAPSETAICEFGAGQFEMNLAHVEDPLAAADHMVALKRAIRGAARAHGFDATFMAKPYGNMAGSGMHLHLSLADATGRNLFQGNPGEANPLLRKVLGGLQARMAECLLIFAPHQNSYRRFMPGSYAPMVAAWGYDNRGVALRVPETSGKGARFEHRVAGSDANPYLVTAAVLAGALDGIDRGTQAGEPMQSEASPGDGAALPLSWAMAEQRFAASDFVAEWLGSEFRRVFSAMKRQERATLLARVSDVEYAAYLRTV
jgi:glutamine synthetase